MYLYRDSNDKVSLSKSHKVMNESSNSGDSTDDESFEEGNSGRTSSSNELLPGGVTSGAGMNGTSTTTASPEASIFSALGSISAGGHTLDPPSSHFGTSIGSQSALSAVTSMGYPHGFRFGHHPSHQSNHFGHHSIHSLHSSPGHHLADVAPSALVMHHAGASSAETMFQLSSVLSSSAAAAAAASVAANPSAFDSYSKYGASMAAAVVAFSGGRPQF